MHFYKALTGLTLALSPSLVGAAGTLGFSLGSVNPDSSAKSQSDYEHDFDVIYSNTGSRLVRIYSASQDNCSQNILPAAANKNFKVLLGVWVATGDMTAPCDPNNPSSQSCYEADRDAIAPLVAQYSSSIYGVTIGSEGIYRGNYTSDELLAMIDDFKAKVPGISTVGTADTWNMYTTQQMDSLIASPNVNLLLSNSFPYWQNQGTPIADSQHIFFQDLGQTVTYIDQVRGSAGPVEIWTGETGWPSSGGSNYGDADSSTVNTETYWNNTVCAALAYGNNVFYFEAFDEPQKAAATGQSGAQAVETVWGAMYSNFTTKFPLTC